MKYIGENLELFLTILVSVITLVVSLNDKLRTLLLTKLNLKSSKARIKKDTSDSNDSIIETMMARINTLGDEFVRLSEVNTITQKENYDLKSRLSDLEYECNELKKRIGKKCLNKCLDV